MLNGKVVVVTGANGALGRVAAEVAAGHGAEVVGLDLRFDGAPGARQHAVDLTDAAATAATLAAVGRIDVVLNIAGGFDMGPAVHETTPEQWAHMTRMNVDTARNVIAAVVPGMLARGRGSIVNVGALSAREGQANMGAYCVAKSTVMRLTESLAKELRSKGINVNAVLPSIIDTPTNRKDMPDADHSRWVAPRDLAEVMCFLGSDAARAVHGALVPVSGLA
ncbi:MAG: SDR family oxidoreductase [Gammaproteobacteria bacterium]|nr:SDR family oxidoreductase [Gammaproteobacteria bacterium]